MKRHLLIILSISISSCASNPIGDSIGALHALADRQAKQRQLQENNEALRKLEKKREKLREKRLKFAGPVPKDHVQMIKKSMQKTLIDPNSMIDFSTTKPILGTCHMRNNGLLGPSFGWIVIAKYKAKNKLGAYAADQLKYFFYNEKIYKHCVSIRAVDEPPPHTKKQLPVYYREEGLNTLFHKGEWKMLEQ